ncbi:MAG: heparinase [Saprospiraceae bacterium]|nr:heparinase [Saprospiraceae bacterium]
MKRNYCIVFLLVFIGLESTLSQTQRNLLQNAANLSTLKNNLRYNQEWVPFPEYSDREGWQKLTIPIREQLVKEGEAYLNYQWEVITLSDYMEFDRSGSREIMQKPLRANHQAALALVLAELTEGEGRFIDQILNSAWLACEMTTWVLSAHLKAFQTSSKLAVPDPNEYTIDLSAGNLGSFYAWVHYFFREEFDKASPLISMRLRDHLQERILEPYVQRSDFWWQSFGPEKFTHVNNWNPWCNFNVLMCYLLLENDRDVLAEVVYRTMHSVDQFINYYDDDGACEEGPSYWSHAAGKMFDYLDLLSLATGGQVAVFEEPIIGSMGEYISKSYVGDGWVVNFADASAKAHGNSALIYRYGGKVESEEMQHFAAYLRDREDPYHTIVSSDINRVLFNLTVYGKLVEEKAQLPIYQSAWYGDTEFCYMQNHQGFFVGAKGSHNGQSHNHNDVGTFSLYVDDIPFFIDVGVGTYTRQTFSSERYDIWTMQSDYHNVPKINGFSQKVGRSYSARSTTFKADEQLFTMDISTAYPKDAQVNEWIRSYDLDEDVLLVEDRFSLQNSLEAQEINFLTWGKPVLIDSGTIHWHSNDVSLQMTFDAGALISSIKTIELADPRLTKIWGTKIYRLSLRETDLDKRGHYQYTITRF